MGLLFKYKGAGHPKKLRIVHLFIYLFIYSSFFSPQDINLSFGMLGVWKFMLFTVSAIDSYLCQPLFEAILKAQRYL